MPSVSMVTLPNSPCAVNTHASTAAMRPPMAPAMAAKPLHLAHVMAQAMGTTALPMTTPINRYTWGGGWGGRWVGVSLGAGGLNLLGKHARRGRGRKAQGAGRGAKAARGTGGAPSRGRGRS